MHFFVSVIFLISDRAYDTVIVLSQNGNYDTVCGKMSHMYLLPVERTKHAFT